MSRTQDRSQPSALQSEKKNIDWSHLRSILAKLGNLPFAKIARAAFKLAVLAAALLIILPSASQWLLTVKWLVWPPQGQIYVDSPEVYTRERLVNERLDEERWLKDEIDSIKDDNLYIPRVFLSEKLSADGEKPSADALPKAQGSADGPPINRLQFDQKFKLKSAYRNLVRQRAIENRLDDRHDLFGNALYMLKFDTTVVSIAAAERRAQVSIRILPAYNLNFVQTLSSAKSHNILGLDDTFREWRKDLERRVNARIQSLHNKFSEGGMSRDELIRLFNHITRRLLEAGARFEFEPQVFTATTYEDVRDAYWSGVECSFPFAKYFKDYFLRRSLSEIIGIDENDLGTVTNADDSEQKVFPVVGDIFSDFISIFFELDNLRETIARVNILSKISHLYLVPNGCDSFLFSKLVVKKVGEVSTGNLEKQTGKYKKFVSVYSIPAPEALQQASEFLSSDDKSKPSSKWDAVQDESINSRTIEEIRTGRGKGEDTAWNDDAETCKALLNGGSPVYFLRAILVATSSRKKWT